jgi:hypothetical protein
LLWIASQTDVTDAAEQDPCQRVSQRLADVPDVEQRKSEPVAKTAISACAHTVYLDVMMSGRGGKANLPALSVVGEESISCRASPIHPPVYPGCADAGLLLPWRILDDVQGRSLRPLIEVPGEVD